MRERLLHFRTYNRIHFRCKLLFSKKKKKHKSRRPSRRIAHRQLRRKFKMERSHAVHHPSLRNWQSSKGALGTSATRCPEQVVSSHKHNQSQLSSPRRQEPQPMQARSIPQVTLKKPTRPLGDNPGSRCPGDRINQEPYGLSASGLPDQLTITSRAGVDEDIALATLQSPSSPGECINAFSTQYGPLN